MVGFLVEGFLGTEPSPAVYFANIGCILGFLFLASRRWPDVLVLPPKIPSQRIALLLIGFSILSYIVLVPIFGILGYLYVQWAWPDPRHKDMDIFVSLMALWLPLWLAPAGGSVLTWRKIVIGSE